MTRPAVAALAVLILVPAPPALGQSFFERLFRPPPQQPVAPPQPIPRAAPQPQPQPQPQPRRAAPQQGAPQAAAPQAPAAIQAEPPPAPYEPDLLRLAEIMGSMAFLRGLCSQSDAPEWPRRMQALLDAEGTSPGRRERIAGAYNRGYRSFGLTYRACTPSANEATNRYLKEGEQLARTLTTRYGG